MSRSLGDNQAHTVGVSAEPGSFITPFNTYIDIFKHEFIADDRFIVIASDGIWEFLENQEVAEIIWPHYVKHTPEAAGNVLVRAAA
jgi:serine/threonine protein phosphatase PrpC